MSKKWINILFKNLKGSSFKYNDKLYELVGTSGRAAVTCNGLIDLEYEIFNDNDIIQVIDLWNEYNDNDIIK